MSTVTLVIHGLALCNPEGSGAECLFFHPDSHILEMRITKNGVQTQKVTIEPQSTIALTFAKATGFLPTGAKPFDLIVDYDVLHNKSLELAHPPMWTLTQMSVSTATLYTHTEDTRTFQLWKKQGALRTLENNSYNVGAKAGMSYEVESGGSVIINVTNSFGQITPYPLPAGDDYEVEFDNTCTASPCGSDYPLYYNMLQLDNMCFEILLPPNISGEDVCNVSSGGRASSILAYFNNAGGGQK